MMENNRESTTDPCGTPSASQLAIYSHTNMFIKVKEGHKNNIFFY